MQAQRCCKFKKFSEGNRKGQFAMNTYEGNAMRDLSAVELEQVAGGGTNPLKTWLPGSTGPTNPMPPLPGPAQE